MKCLSLWQPWASALFILDSAGLPIKPDETRGWSTDIRGRIAIHAAQHRLPAYQAGPYIDALKRIGVDWTSLPYGALIGSTEIVRVRPAPEALILRSREQSVWGDYREYGDNGKLRYAFEMANPVLLPAPIPFNGFQRFFEVPDELFGLPPKTEISRLDHQQLSLTF